MASGNILVVDDDRFFRELVVSILASGGHQVTVAEDGETAYGLSKKQTFDVVISDLVMPGLDGLALTLALRQGEPEQEVILVTTKSDASAAISALRAGASDYLLKPIDDAELLRCVKRSMERVALRRERARLLDENLEFVKNQVLYQRCLELLSTLDLERLQEACLADLCTVCDAQSGAIWLMEDGGALTLRAYRGLVDRAALDQSIDPRTSVLKEGLTGKSPFAAPGHEIGRSFYLPLRAGGEVVGLVLCADKLTGEFTPPDQSVARAVGDFAATALRNARRFQAVERLGLRDQETAAYNLSYFIDYAGKEFYKARRYGRVFSLLTVALDQFEDYRNRRGAEDARAVTRAVIAALGRCIRDSDVIAKVAEGEFYVLLPETDYLGALLFSRRAQAAIDQDPTLTDLDARHTVTLSVGAATFPRDGQEFEELVHECRRRMEETRQSLARRLNLAPLDFWSAVDLLVGERTSPKLPGDDLPGPSRRGHLPPALFGLLQTELAREIGRDPRARGLMYIGCGEIRADLPAIAALEKVPAESGMRVYLLGRRADLTAHPAATPVYLEGDDRILKHEFLIVFSENASYALIQKRAQRGPPWGFHTSDAGVVNELVVKLQQRYDLQPF